MQAQEDVKLIFTITIWCFPMFCKIFLRKKNLRSQGLRPQGLRALGRSWVGPRSQVLGLGLSLGLGPGPQVASDFERVRLHWMAKILEIIFEAPHVSQKKIGHTTYTTESGKQPDFKMISKQLEKKSRFGNEKSKQKKKQK